MLLWDNLIEAPGRLPPFEQCGDSPPAGVAASPVSIWERIVTAVTPQHRIC